DDWEQVGFIVHRGDEKDPGSDMFLMASEHGREVWIVSGSDKIFTEVPDLQALPDGDIGKAQAYWPSSEALAWAIPDGDAEYRLYHSSNGSLELNAEGLVGGEYVTLTVDDAGLATDVTAKFPHLAGLTALTVPADTDVDALLTGQLAVAAIADDGRVLGATGLQIPGVIDDRYATTAALGVTFARDVPTMSVWAPTARSVRLHVFNTSSGTRADLIVAMDRDAQGVWSARGEASWVGKFYLYEVEVFAPTVGSVVRNVVTDPYSVSLATNSGKSQIIDLTDPTLAPLGWDDLEKPDLAAPEDIVLYELHVRDFSAIDQSVPEEFRGTYKAFTLPRSAGMDHLTKLADAGLTHVHLLPVFDIATIDEDPAARQEPDVDLASFPPDSSEQQAAIGEVRDLDAFNWGYDPFHYTVPEGSYSTSPDGAARILEFREMVQSLNEAGLRVVMDVVYNHTNASGQGQKSVLDRIVPGYYHRLDANGLVATSTCCANTATEHDMMRRLMVDSVVTWAEQYRVDGFRFDLMGHHMVDDMAAVRSALGQVDSTIYVYGEGWDFGEVGQNARGANATQLNVGGFGIGTFNDRIRDAVRGGSPFGGLQEQGFATGLYNDPNETDQGGVDDQLADLLLKGDQIRAGMAANLADYAFESFTGEPITGSEVDYNGAPTGYTTDPQEVINYVSAHDNETFFDIVQTKSPLGMSMEDRTRIQNLALDIVAFGQGIPFFHAGSELLRSKSLDKDSYNSGDWFNAIDFTYKHNGWANGLPVEDKNADRWDLATDLFGRDDLVPSST
ncbi:MAG: pullulanase-type alpha-1,6-glucosidase, partial [Acidimicrobiia bacterium]|nr:pullulanase-type alpha-1,6-glucosidase [Acidimicrobiia bacterium]